MGHSLGDAAKKTRKSPLLARDILDITQIAKASAGLSFNAAPMSFDYAHDLVVSLRLTGMYHRISPTR
ncbi:MULTISPECIES: hypothetical protein [Bradyrhizobium]|uniref:hypothetical protein n=1 Tax=Bradyrhizobium TaxID=374 RepID=UPI001163EE88|nr:MULTISPECIES: hypothetical protein [Bradyrhizobium]QDP22733.1 hypothetical protein FNV92_11445 [Bradyrhizobium cosmicum]